MKKILAVALVIVLTIITIVFYNYNMYKSETQRNKKINEEYEAFTQGDILGTSLITLINKAIDNNKKNNIELDNNNFYIDNGKTSIIIKVKFLESDEIFSMESIGKLGSEKFIKNYATTNFKCTKKEYHEKTNNIKYLLFEQI